MNSSAMYILGRRFLWLLAFSLILIIIEHYGQYGLAAIGLFLVYVILSGRSNGKKIGISDFVLPFLVLVSFTAAAFLVDGKTSNFLKNIGFLWSVWLFLFVGLFYDVLSILKK